MLGGSAIITADVIKKLGVSTEICCIDPFCGDVNMWAWEKDKFHSNQWRFLKIEGGKPTIYDRFLANIKAAKHNDIIIPITCTSIIGMKLLLRLAYEGRLQALPDVIYLDSAHEPNETLIELINAWNILPTGGVLAGDDWSWDSVRNDLMKFANQTSDIDVAALQQIQVVLPNSIIDHNILVQNGSQWMIIKK